MGAGADINKRQNLRNSAASNDADSANFQQAARMEAQQGFRFVLRVSGIPVGVVKDVTRPSYTAKNKDFQLLNWKIKFPLGTIEWSDVTFTVIELFSNDVTDTVAGILLKKMTENSYDTPDKLDLSNIKDMSKASMVATLGTVKIELINPEGKKYEEYSLINAWVKEIKFDKLGYNSESVIGASVTLCYDWANVSYFNKSNAEKRY
tara:strand:- start:17048 stop:17665 length:618 start_codon:yes stop_codon:yes gene_type:complete